MLSRLIVDYFEIINIKLNVSGGTTMKITVCIGSSCHIKGSRQVVEQLQYLIKSNHLSDEVELAGTFCMANASRVFALPLTTNSILFHPQRSIRFLSRTFSQSLNKPSGYCFVYPDKPAIDKGMLLKSELLDLFQKMKGASCSELHRFKKIQLQKLLQVHSPLSC